MAFQTEKHVLFSYLHEMKVSGMDFDSVAIACRRDMKAFMKVLAFLKDVPSDILSSWALEFDMKSVKGPDQDQDSTITDNRRAKRAGTNSETNARAGPSQATGRKFKPDSEHANLCSKDKRCRGREVWKVRSRFDTHFKKHHVKKSPDLSAFLDHLWNNEMEGVPENGTAKSSVVEKLAPEATPAPPAFNKTQMTSGQDAAQFPNHSAPGSAYMRPGPASPPAPRHSPYMPGYSPKSDNGNGGAWPGSPSFMYSLCLMHDTYDTNCSLCHQLMK